MSPQATGLSNARYILLWSTIGSEKPQNDVVPEETCNAASLLSWLFY